MGDKDLPKIALIVKSDGETFYVSSPDVPGLHVAGRDFRQTLNVVPDAITRLCELNKIRHPLLP